MNTILLLLFSSISIPDSCETMYLNHLEIDMKLTYIEFDQTMDSGFRPLAKSCPNEAIDLIKNYIIINKAKENSLRWHIAQLLGEQGKIIEAELYALSTLNDTSEGEFKWNDYVEGYISYWQNDVDGLKEKIKVLESSSGHKGNLINANLLKTFLAEINQ